MLWYRISARPAIMVLANTIAMRVTVPADDEENRIRLCPADFLLSLSRLGGR